MYDCNAILTTVMKNISDKEMIRAFTSLTEYLKIRGINPGFYFMDNEVCTVLKMKMTSINIKYQLVTPNIHIANNAERAIKTFKNHLISVLYRVDTYFHLQLWYTLLQQAIISLKFLRQSRTLPHISAYTHIFG